MALPKDFSTLNIFGVGMRGDGLVLLRPPARPITKAESLNLLAYLVVLNAFSAREVSEAIGAVEDA